MPIMTIIITILTSNNQINFIYKNNVCVVYKFNNLIFTRYSQVWIEKALISLFCRNTSRNKLNLIF